MPIASDALFVREHGNWFFTASPSFMLDGFLMRTASSVALFTCKGSVPKSPWALGVVLAGLLVVGVAPADLRAATTTYTTAYSSGTIAPGDDLLPVS